MTEAEIERGKAQLGANLRRARAAGGLTQRELAKASGLTQRAVNYFETGRRVPNFASLLKLARGLGMRAADLLEGVG